MSKKEPSHSTQHQALKENFDRFIYAVSHDFSAPLRHLREFNTLLLEKLGDKVGEGETKYVGIIHKALDDMEEMFESLLDMSRIVSDEEEPKQLSVPKLISQAKHPLHNDIQQHGLKVTLDKDLPDIHANEAQMVRVFSELLRNAITFRHEGKEPELHVSGEQKPDGICVLAFRDNGGGIPEYFHEDAFTIFRKLHTEPHHEGMGAGLSLCQTVVQHMGGDIWFETEEGEGTTFYLTLPTYSAK